jgi:predicted RNA-binding Zn ribbon-like protein
MMQTADFSAVPSDAAERLATFLNSHGVGFDARRDLLDEAAQAGDSSALGYPGVPAPSGADKDEARAVRTLLLGGIGDVGVFERPELNALAAALPWVYRFGADGRAAQAPVRGVLAAWVLRDLALVAGAGHWGRIKVCANDACNALFYDATRAQTKRWHSFELCGNKANVAAHRRRHAADDKGVGGG